MTKGLFISGNGTEVGKTLVSAIVTEALQADYWKPIQTGSIERADRTVVSSLVTNQRSHFHPETHHLVAPIAPHAAAELEGKAIHLSDFEPPRTDNFLVVEGAGGILVPLNYTEFILDLVKKLGFPVLVVSRNYLGSINHTLLTCEVLRLHNVPMAGIVFNGHPTPATERVILQHTGLRCIGRVSPEDRIDSTVVKEYAARFTPNLRECLDGARAA